MHIILRFLTIYCDMTLESRNSSLLRNSSVNIPAEAHERNNRTAMCSLVRAASVAMQLWGKHISAAVNQHATLEEVVFSVWADPRLYKEDSRPAE
jgi:hypothetical protein